MESIFSKTIELLRYGIRFSQKRQELISDNIANVDTPGFKSKDLVFKNELDFRMGVIPVSFTDNGYPDIKITGKIAEKILPTVIMDNPNSVRLDNNTVDIEREMAKMVKNTIYHNALIQLISSKFNQLKSAISARI